MIKTGNRNHYLVCVVSQQPSYDYKSICVPAYLWSNIRADSIIGHNTNHLFPSLETAFNEKTGMKMGTV